MYEQKLSDDIAKRSASAHANISETDLPNVRVNLCVNQNVIGASLTHDSDATADTNKITLTKQNTLTHTLQEDTYDAVICGTGYDRTAWIRLLRASNFAHEFGLGSNGHEVCELGRVEFGKEKEAPVKLVPEHYIQTAPSMSSPPRHVPLSLDISGEKKRNVLDFTSFASQAFGNNTNGRLIPSSLNNDIDHEPEHHETGSDGEDSRSLTSLSSPSSPIISPTETTNTSLLANSLTMSDLGKKKDDSEVDEVRVRISRAYQLLPDKISETHERLGENEEVLNGANYDRKGGTKIYVQGSAEATHGLSDSLLSVISVRSGEVVKDMFNL